MTPYTVAVETSKKGDTSAFLTRKQGPSLLGKKMLWPLLLCLLLVGMAHGLPMQSDNARNMNEKDADDFREGRMATIQEECPATPPPAYEDIAGAAEAALRQMDLRSTPAPKGINGMTQAEIEQYLQDALCPSPDSSEDETCSEKDTPVALSSKGKGKEREQRPLLEDPREDALEEKLKEYNLYEYYNAQIKAALRKGAVYVRGEVDATIHAYQQDVVASFMKYLREMSSIEIHPYLRDAALLPLFLVNQQPDLPELQSIKALAIEKTIPIFLCVLLLRREHLLRGADLDDVYLTSEAGIKSKLHWHGKEYNGKQWSLSADLCRRGDYYWRATGKSQWPYLDPFGLEALAAEGALRGVAVDLIVNNPF